MNWNSIHVNIFCVYMSTAENEQRNNILRLRRRFLRDQGKVSLSFAQKEIRQQRQKKVSNMHHYAYPYSSWVQFILYVTNAW